MIYDIIYEIHLIFLLIVFRTNFNVRPYSSNSEEFKV